MTTLANNVNIRILGNKFEEKYLCLPATAQTFYTGMPVVLDASYPTGVVVADGCTVTTSDVFLGIAAEKLVTVVADVAKYITTLTYPSIVGLPNTGSFTIADLGKPIYAYAYTATAITLSASSSGSARLGKLFDVRDGYAFIEIDSYVH